jgi:L-asparaginase
VTVEYDIRALLHKDSLDLTDDDRALIVAAGARHAGRAVSHHPWTDTMLQTAEGAPEGVPGKVMVLTGSMQPPRAARAMPSSISASRSAPCQQLPPGAYVAMNGQVFRPGAARKNVGQGRFEAI